MNAVQVFGAGFWLEAQLDALVPDHRRELEVTTAEFAVAPEAT
jgi:hypothetical protein